MAGTVIHNFFARRGLENWIIHGFEATKRNLIRARKKSANSMYAHAYAEQSDNLKNLVKREREKQKRSA